ncbi:DMT family transporter [Actinoallomurus purpureus]|uniref:DMT family transporter n=1 Tax=Actinoallomurus purpureus TaxID=478114 RepID=UPI00209361DE|nr:DMT family transporter [Actinoallomurus purpureus]MCO6010772.1 DMT family transporter [Actinoallomurus purpureus]
MGFGVPLALLGAMLFAVSAALQQHAARSAARRPAPGRAGAGRRAATTPGGAPLGGTRRRVFSEKTPPPLRVSTLLVRLARDPLWLLGWTAGIAGFGAQALALHLGSLVVVQSLLVTQLLFALPLNAVVNGRRPLPRDWAGAAMVCAGLVLLVTVHGEVPRSAGRRADLGPVVAAAAALIGLLVLTARLLRSRAQSRTAVLAVAAGVCFCMTAVFLVFAGDDLTRRGLLAVALDWPPAALAASTALGTVLVQAAFAGGSLPTAMTSMTITDPIAGWVVGMAVFDVPRTARAGALWGSALAIALIAAGAAALATSPTLHDERRSSSRR